MRRKTTDYTRVKQQADEKVELNCINANTSKRIPADKTKNDNGMNLTCFTACKITQHIKCWTLTILLWICIIMQIICSIINVYDINLECSSLCIAFYPCKWFYITITIFSVLIICYIFEALCSSSGKYVCKLREINDDKPYIKRIIKAIKSQQITLHWKGEWFHQEKIQKEGQNATIKTVITHIQTEIFECDVCIDKSKWDLQQIKNIASRYGIACIRFKLETKFANQITEDEYNKQFEQFKNAFVALNKDRYYRIVELFEPQSLNTLLNKTVYVENKTWNKSSYLNAGCYLLSTLFLILPCYKMWMTTKVGNNKYKVETCEFIKEFNVIVDTELLIHAFFRWFYDGEIEYVTNGIAKLIEKYYGENIAKSYGIKRVNDIKSIQYKPGNE